MTMSEITIEKSLNTQWMGYDPRVVKTDSNVEGRVKQ